MHSYQGEQPLVEVTTPPIDPISSTLSIHSGIDCLATYGCVNSLSALILHRSSIRTEALTGGRGSHRRSLLTVNLLKLESHEYIGHWMDSPCNSYTVSIGHPIFLSRNDFFEYEGSVTILAGRQAS